MAEQLLRIDELSKYLKVSPITLYRWVSEKKIPHMKVGSSVRFRKEEIDKWLEEKKNV